MAYLESDNESIESNDSDKELQIAFEHGLLKPGMNVIDEKPLKAINNVDGLKHALAELKNDLPWKERLDVTTGLAPAPKAMQLDDEQDDLTGDRVHDDFKREMIFYRQAQAAALVGLPRLKGFGILTKRPGDYYAEMVKSDDHMKKVREKLLAKQMGMERSEKAKKMRELRKYGKKVQHEVLLKRQKEKREMMEAVKKYKKGKGNLDFLDDIPGKKGSQQGNKNTHQSNKKREFKNKKFGFGGQKKRSKSNDAKSSADFSDFGGIRTKAKGKKGAKQNTRPGKQRRKVIKNKRK